MSWKHIKIPNGDTMIFCNSFITRKSSMNIVVTHTPIVTTLEMQKAYEPLAKHNVNIFAFDFSGTGKSDGYEKDFSRNSIVKDLDSVITYIEKIILPTYIYMGIRELVVCLHNIMHVQTIS
ncbi:hypothetical protein AWI46_05785 [Clostridioides difficile]|nr:hypothetical protein AWI46_05785 [Clostridioides difficile]PPS78865.1 hypothetical protein AWI47_07030 [Clostridioides difficile]